MKSRFHLSVGARLPELYRPVLCPPPKKTRAIPRNPQPCGGAPAPWRHPPIGTPTPGTPHPLAYIIIYQLACFRVPLSQRIPLCGSPPRWHRVSCVSLPPSCQRTTFFEGEKYTFCKGNSCRGKSSLFELPSTLSYFTAVLGNLPSSAVQTPCLGPRLGLAGPDGT